MVKFKLFLPLLPYWNKRTYSEEKGLGNEKTSEEFVENLSEHLKIVKEY
jgi:hypothetical protein